MDVFSESIKRINGVGEIRLKQFRMLGINNIYDMITNYPRTYENRSVIKEIGELKDGDTCSFVGEVSTSIRQIRANKLTIYKFRVVGKTGSIIVVFHNQHYIKDIFLNGRKFIFYGRVERDNYGLAVKDPAFCEYSEGKLKRWAGIVPVYNLTRGLSQNVARSLIQKALLLTKRYIKDFMPQKILDKCNLEGLEYAIENIHMPKSQADFLRARRRLDFDEFFLLQLALFSIKREDDIENNELKIYEHDESNEFIAGLPFELTNAQKRTIKEILDDMKSNKVMNRLVQGDVGCGKTIVSVVALLNTVKSGYQGIMLAPTEILARQHYETLKNLLDKFDIKIGLLLGSMKKREKNKLLDRIMIGQIDIVVGTHAILQDSVIFDNVGLVITDEQHRFGVKQRSILSKKGERPHVLAMSATPIPRTLALILYGDLDISIIDELPPERKKVTTVVIGEDKKERMNNFIRQKVKEGRQVYIVCPLVEDSENIDAKSVNILADKLKKEDFYDLNVSLIHGKLSSQKKDEIMEDFKCGKIDILISTTVIEVGVNVPNASIMVIENAERFGLSTLHQLRGRVGRGDKEAFCILVTNNKSDLNKKRMDIMKSTNDGFLISQKDLELRGIGDFFGTRQHGLPDFKIANIYNDMEILKKAQIAAQDVINEGEVYEELKKEVNNRFLKKLKEDIVLN